MSNKSERRTVHPLITQAILDGLDQAKLKAPGLEDARATLQSGHALDERDHRSLKQFLFEFGGPWRSFDTGWKFAKHTNHPLLALLTASRSPAELIHRARRLEPLLHLGNRTVIRVADDEMHVSHQSNRGAPPTLGESLFVCGSQCAMLERIGVTGVIAHATLGSGSKLVLWPPRGRSEAIPEEFNQWTICWTTAPSCDPLPSSGVLADDIRARIIDQPELPWTVAETAKEFALSPRSLQRSLQQQQTQLRNLVQTGRVEAARAFLTRTDMSVSVIAYLCGFSDGAHLANVTQSLLQQTPTALRTQSAHSYCVALRVGDFKLSDDVVFAPTNHSSNSYPDRAS
jgi:AraC-like DNA-binding protein